MIYHYTSISTLALIFESKKLRFTRLDLLDDLQEYSLYKTFPIYYSHYVSCWTESAIENIPLWKMYSDMNGVRIGIKKESIKLPSVTDPESMRSYDDFYVLPTDHIRPYLQKIQYVDDVELNKIINATVQRENNVIEVGKNGEGVACHKSKYWEFQNESRYILQIFSVKEGDLKTALLNLTNGIKPNEEFFDIPFLDDAFIDIEIALGPKCTYAEELIVKALLKAYSLEAVVKKSNLTEVIRRS